MRIGFLGVAHVHADAYVVALRAAGAEVVGATDHDPVRVRAWCDEHQVPWSPAREPLLGRVDGVLVCSETTRHRVDVEAAAAAGVAVLCEKPLATTDTDALAIVEGCTAADVPLVTAFPMRYSLPMRQVAEQVAGGQLGTILAAHGTNQGELPMRHRSWFVDPRESGGGALMDHVVHLADVLRWLLGQDPVEVYAATNRILHAGVVPVETGGLVVLTYADGTFASIDCSWSKPDDYPTWGGLTLELIAEGGVTEVDAFSQHLVVHGGPHGPLGWLDWGADPNRGLVEDFLAVMRDGVEPRATGQDGLAATRVALAAARSAASGEPVTLDHVRTDERAERA
ncbi:Gfo/Idh/MocA family protein [Nitriliruptor alkaliphilus]|uniref:Gfo/Idh/MocA family protein n=1 Tax=Nitriliruptor alkaliphilus TaxID=427918 RepID=UPI000695CD30|nr:Gfo/Idh/MocA family oxidoreductase [Nitriliruptor alkaliphilus]